MWFRKFDAGGLVDSYFPWAEDKEAIAAALERQRSVMGRGVVEQAALVLSYALDESSDMLLGKLQVVCKGVVYGRDAAWFAARNPASIDTHLKPAAFEPAYRLVQSAGEDAVCRLVTAAHDRQEDITWLLRQLLGRQANSDYLGLMSEAMGCMPAEEALGLRIVGLDARLEIEREAASQPEVRRAYMMEGVEHRAAGDAARQAAQELGIRRIGFYGTLKVMVEAALARVQRYDGVLAQALSGAATVRPCPVPVGVTIGYLPQPF